MKAIVVERHGDPEVMELRDLPEPEPAEGEVVVRVEAIGVNFHDVWVCRGFPGIVELPAVQGIEVAGVVESVGPGVSADREGRRVMATPFFEHGAYAERVAVPLERVFPRPEGMDPVDAAAFPVNFLMAWAALEVSARVRQGDTVLVHGAAGGVGSAAVQLARLRDARVLGTASPGKHAFVRELGADPVDYRTGDWTEVVMERTDGAGVDIVLDGVGEDGFRPSLSVLAFGGRLVTYGLSAAMGAGVEQAERAFEENPFTLLELNENAVSVAASHLGAPPELLRSWMDALLERWEAGEIRPRVDRTYPLEEADRALRRLLDRENRGKVVLVP